MSRTDRCITTADTSSTSQHPGTIADVANPSQVDQPSPDIHAALAEVWRRVAEWHDSPHWTDEDRNRHRYETTAVAYEAARQLPHTDTDALAKAVQPIVDTWRPNRPGPQQTIHAAVDRLRDALRAAGREAE
jgi:hypothetical protein